MGDEVIFSCGLFYIWLRYVMRVVDDNEWLCAKGERCMKDIRRRWMHCGWFFPRFFSQFSFLPSLYSLWTYHVRHHRIWNVLVLGLVAAAAVVVVVSIIQIWLERNIQMIQLRSLIRLYFFVLLHVSFVNFFLFFHYFNFFTFFLHSKFYFIPAAARK